MFPLEGSWSHAVDFQLRDNKSSDLISNQLGFIIRACKIVSSSRCPVDEGNLGAAKSGALCRRKLHPHLPSLLREGIEQMTYYVRKSYPPLKLSPPVLIPMWLSRTRKIGRTWYQKITNSHSQHNYVVQTPSKSTLQGWASRLAPSTRVSTWG